MSENNSLQIALEPLFQKLPLTHAMPSLSGSHPVHTSLIEELLQFPLLQQRPELAAGLWLYADNLERCHDLCQNLPDSTGAWWHGIMHRREPDYPNAHYWMRRAERAVAPELLRLNPHQLIDQVSLAAPADTQGLLALQRQEWAVLFEYYVRGAGSSISIV